jgi:hypothetical protein
MAATGEIISEMFLSLQEHFIVYCTCREAVELFRLLLSPHSLSGAWNSVQNIL